MYILTERYHKISYRNMALGGESCIWVRGLVRWVEDGAANISENSLQSCVVRRENHLMF